MNVISFITNFGMFSSTFACPDGAFDGFPTFTSFLMKFSFQKPQANGKVGTDRFSLKNIPICHLTEPFATFIIIVCRLFRDFHSVYISNAFFI